MNANSHPVTGTTGSGPQTPFIGLFQPRHYVSTSMMPAHDQGASYFAAQAAAQQFEQSLRAVIREEIRAALKEDE